MPSIWHLYTLYIHPYTPECPCIVYTNAFRGTVFLYRIYIAGATNCGNEFEQSTVYWIAVDQFTKALVYESTLDQARKSINTYSKYFPTKEECFFNGGLENGEIYTVQCWINKQTKVRTSD